MKIGNSYNIIETENSDGKTLGFATEQNLIIPIDMLYHIPDIGPSGVVINNNKYRIFVSGDFVDKTPVEVQFTPEENVPIADEVEGIPNRIHIGQELLIMYKGKPIGDTLYGPDYGLSYEEDLSNMSSDIFVTVIDVASTGDTTMIDVISATPLYYIDDENGSFVCTNFNERLSDKENKNYPGDLYTTNLQKNGLLVNIDFYFTNTIVSATSFTIAYRRKLYSGNSTWNYIDNVQKSPFTLIGLNPNEEYEIRIMTYFDNKEYSRFSPKITFKTS